MLAAQLVQKLKDKQRTVTAAESLTCGLFQATLGDISGVSAVFPGGFVTYSAQLKEWLGVPADIVQQFGTVSAECAKEMALSAKKAASTDYAISFTGVAGPDLLEGKAVGTIWIGIATPCDVQTYLLQSSGTTRQAIRQEAVEYGVKCLLEVVNNSEG